MLLGNGPLAVVDLHFQLPDGTMDSARDTVYVINIEVRSFLFPNYLDVTYPPTIYTK